MPGKLFSPRIVRKRLNLAIHGLLRPGDHAVCTAADHNSVLRPLKFLEDRGDIEVTRVPCDRAGLVDPDDARRALPSEHSIGCDNPRFKRNRRRRAGFANWQHREGARRNFSSTRLNHLAI